MKIARLGIGTQTLLARVEGEGAFPLVLDSGESWVDPLRVWLESDRSELSGNVVALESARILPPVRAPQKIIAVGLNYRDHADEQGKAIPATPMLFTKSPGAIIGNDDDIVFRPADSDRVDYEGELAVVIGSTARDVTVENALKHVFGYTICNDVSARDAQETDGQYFRAKSFDTFCPLGPWIVTGDEIPDPQALGVRTRVNGDLRQDGSTLNMIFGVAELIAYISRFMTLEPGDVVTTGTPGGVGVGLSPPVFLKDGDTIEVEINGIGVLRNHVRTVN